MKKHLFINGRWKATEKFTPLLSLYNDEVIAEIPAATEKQVDEAIDFFVNDSRFGFQAGIYTNNVHHALAASEKLEVGGVIINDIPTFRVDHMHMEE